MKRQNVKSYKTIMIEEMFIRENVGQGNCFKVPEGYFEQMKSQLLVQLPDKKAKTSVLSSWIYVAACSMAALMLGVTYYMHQQPQDDAVAESSYMEEAADYAMIDNTDIYACLSEE